MFGNPAHILLWGATKEGFCYIYRSVEEEAEETDECFELCLQYIEKLAAGASVLCLHKKCSRIHLRYSEMYI